MSDIDKFTWELDMEARAEQAMIKNKEFEHKLKLAAERNKDAWKVHELLDDTSIPPAPVAVDMTGGDLVRIGLAIVVAGVCVGIFVFLWMFS